MFTSDPSYCPLIYSYSVTDLDNGESAVTSISPNDRTLTFFYDSDLTPVDATTETQTITVTATSASIYTYANPADLSTKSNSDTFDLSFESPCDKDSLVSITETA